MPYHVAETGKCPASKPWGCIKSSTGEVMGCHPTKEAATKQLQALYANEPRGHKSMAKVDDSPWDASKAWANGAASDDPAAFYNAICAGKKAGDPKTQAAHALPYKYTPSSAPNAAGVKAALSRLPQTDGLTNKAEAQSKLEGLMKTIQAAKSEKSSPRMSVRALRAQHSNETPSGQARMAAFPSKMRANLITKDGRQFFEVEGYATVFNRGYPMWDQFGPYQEVADAHMLDRSLAMNPDVAFLLNHKGMTMARTKNGTLQLSKDDHGLKTYALLNAERSDVQDMARAINDGLIDEMSFAFMIDDGQWNDDFSEFRLMSVDINRGDVSAVNYGANPWTSIGARAQDFMRMANEIPAGMAREAITLLAKREDVRALEDPEDDETRAMPEDPTTGPIDSAEAEPVPNQLDDSEASASDDEETETSAKLSRAASKQRWEDSEIPAGQPDGDMTEETRAMPDGSVKMYANQWTLLMDES